MKRLLTLAILLLTALVPVHAAAASAPHQSFHTAARFGTTHLDIGQSWGSAKACLVQVTGVTCFTTEADLDAFVNGATQAVAGIVSQTTSLVGGLVSAAVADCGTYLRLYSASGYGGSVLAIATQATWINLSSYGFDNVTSSYRIGDCAATFRDGSNGGGSTYPGPTGAGVSASSMVSGWDNRVSSIYIA